MKRWPTRPLGELLTTLENGSRPKGGVGELSDGIPSLGGEHINRDGGFVWNSPKHITLDFYAGMKRGKIQRGDILVVKDGATTGKTATVRDNFPFKEAAINEHVFLLRTDKSKVLPEFVGYFLFGPVGQQQILSNFHGAAIGGIAQDFVRNVHIPLAPLVEQERIVMLLDAGDELRKLRAEANCRAASLIPALFHEMFGDPFTNQKGWPQRLFASVGQLDRGRSKNRPRDEASLYGGKYPFIQTGDVAKSNGQITGYTQTYSEKGLAQSRIWPAGTLVITIAANIGKTAILTFPACFPDSLVGFVPGDDVVVDYVRQWLVTMESRLEEAAPQMAQKNINLEILSGLTIPVPPLPLQKEFAHRVTEIRAMEAVQSASRQRLEALFQSMLHRAFNDEL
jgi:type I restriction enzyme S subunit